MTPLMKSAAIRTWMLFTSTDVQQLVRFGAGPGQTVHH